MLNANRHVTGMLRGFDQFMNIVLDQTVDMKTKTDIGMVVSEGMPARVPGQALHLLRPLQSGSWPLAVDRHQPSP